MKEGNNTNNTNNANNTNMSNNSTPLNPAEAAAQALTAASNTADGTGAGEQLALKSVEMLQVAERAEMVPAGRNGSFQPEQPQRWP